MKCGWTEAAILYWVNWINKAYRGQRAYRANKAYRVDTANSGQRLIWLMLFIKADVPDMAIGIYLSKSK